MCVCVRTRARVCVCVCVLLGNSVLRWRHQNPLSSYTRTHTHTHTHIQIKSHCCTVWECFEREKPDYFSPSASYRYMRVCVCLCVCVCVCRQQQQQQQQLLFSLYLLLYNLYRVYTFRAEQTILLIITQCCRWSTHVCYCSKSRSITLQYSITSKSSNLIQSEHLTGNLSCVIIYHLEYGRYVLILQTTSTPWLLYFIYLTSFLFLKCCLCFTSLSCCCSFNNPHVCCCLDNPSRAAVLSSCGRFVFCFIFKHPFTFHNIWLNDSNC